jgi:peptidoglycan/LPS O-acetylase OafA/YrhL
VGVDLFFVLSGFLVSGLLFAEYQSRGTFAIRRFYVRRWWKIYPPLAYLVLLSGAVSVALGDTGVSGRMLVEMLFMQNYLPRMWGHTWSLAVEEHFYLLLPVTLRLITRHPRGVALVPHVASAIAIVSLALRLLNWSLRDEFSALTHIFPTHLRMDSLWFGVALSYVYHFHPAAIARLAPWRRWLLLGGAMLFLPAFVWDYQDTPALYTIGLTALQFAAGALVLGALLSHWSPCLAPLAWVGASSYSIYLWHMPVIHWGLPLLGSWDTYGLRLVTAVVGSVAVGIAMGRLVERPTLRLRDALWPPLASAVR